MNTEKYEFNVIASEEEIQNLNTLLNFIYDEKEDKEIREKVTNAKNISGQLVNQLMIEQYRNGSVIDFTPMQH